MNNNNNNNNNNILIILDGSYFLYFILFGAISAFQKLHSIEAKQWIKHPDEVDQNNLPNLLNCDTFKKILKKQTMKRLETVDWLTKANFQDQVDTANRIDILFAQDDWLVKSFRKDIYPQYKAQRQLVKRSYNVYAIKKYITDVIFKELELEKNYGYHMLQVEGAEGDDVIACICKNLAKDYMLTILYASDKDFIQLEGIYQYNLFGKKIECKIGDQEVSHQEYILGKILLGDGSDNISKVFQGVGPKKVMKLIKDRNLLKERLEADQHAAEQFLLNKKLMSFNEIPKELEDKIVTEANKLLYENEVINKKIDMNDFMML